MIKMIERMLLGRPVYKVEFIATGYMGNRYIAHADTVAAKDEIDAACKSISKLNAARKLSKLTWKYRAKVIGYERDFLIMDFFYRK
ncbi:hypothetical protein VPHK24_0038 [Vibrio phage K24]|nr:hypothetical protein SIPHO078v2_p0029 [Vibrio phage 14E30.1]QZI92473.1 hypothetical protein SIPHO058v2_p0025 [Vibrio phage 14E30.2]